jgi:folate-dependent phosphoribosylglycinamide formyltransferase PurN
MFRFLFRFAGLVVIAISFLFVVYDGTKSIADQTTCISRVGPTWVNIHPNSLSAFEPAVETLAGADSTQPERAGTGCSIHPVCQMGADGGQS